jgi:hypothetical protein
MDFGPGIGKASIGAGARFRWGELKPNWGTLAGSGVVITTAAGVSRVKVPQFGLARKT